MTYVVNSPIFGREVRCYPGEAEFPIDCERHRIHHWCETCAGYYGVPHDNVHVPGHVDRDWRDCVCRPCTNRRAEVEARKAAQDVAMPDKQKPTDTTLDSYPASDPAVDLVGTVRRETWPGGYSTWVRFCEGATPGNEWTCLHSTEWPRIDCTRGHEEMTVWPVIGAVPGTPAMARFSARAGDRDVDVQHVIEAEIAIARLTKGPGGEPIEHDVTRVAHAVAHAFGMDLTPEAEAARPVAPEVHCD